MCCIIRIWEPRDRKVGLAMGPGINFSFEVEDACWTVDPANQQGMVVFQSQRSQ